MKKHHLLTALITGAALATLLVGCGGQSSSASGNAQTLNLTESDDPTTLDVNDMRNSNENDILSEVQEGLTAIQSTNGKDKVVLTGAKSYTKSADGLTYTFKLRDAKWSDGKAVTAQQYVDSFRRLLKKENAFSQATNAYFIKGALITREKAVLKTLVSKQLIRTPSKFNLLMLTRHSCQISPRLCIIRFASTRLIKSVIRSGKLT